jgi:hypothetical protein
MKKKNQYSKFGGGFRGNILKKRLHNECLQISKTAPPLNLGLHMYIEHNHNLATNKTQKVCKFNKRIEMKSSICHNLQLQPINQCCVII